MRSCCWSLSSAAASDAGEIDRSSEPAGEVRPDRAAARRAFLLASCCCSCASLDIDDVASGAFSATGIASASEIGGCDFSCLSASRAVLRAG